MLSDIQIQRILRRAIGCRILIVTASDSSAVEIKRDIIDYLNQRGNAGCMAFYSEHNEIKFRGAYQDIKIYPHYMWEQKPPMFPFDGEVYITNRKIKVENVRNAPRNFMELIGGNNDAGTYMQQT